MEAGKAKQARNCRKKIRYESAEAAQYFAHADGLRAYKCPVCKHYHLTSQNVRKAHRQYRALG